MDDWLMYLIIIIIHRRQYCDVMMTDSFFIIDKCSSTKWIKSAIEDIYAHHKLLVHGIRIKKKNPDFLPQRWSVDSVYFVDRRRDRSKCRRVVWWCHVHQVAIFTHRSTFGKAPKGDKEKKKGQTKHSKWDNPLPNKVNTSHRWNEKQTARIIISPSNLFSNDIRKKKKIDHVPGFRSGPISESSNTWCAQIELHQRTQGLQGCTIAFRWLTLTHTAHDDWTKTSPDWTKNIAKKGGRPVFISEKGTSHKTTLAMPVEGGHDAGRSRNDIILS